MSSKEVHSNGYPSPNPNLLFDDKVVRSLDYSQSPCFVEHGLTYHHPGTKDGRNLTARPLEKTDFSKGYLQLLSQLTTVGTCSEDTFKEQFSRMQNTPGYHYTIVVEDPGQGQEGKNDAKTKAVKGPGLDPGQGSENDADASEASGLVGLDPRQGSENDADASEAPGLIGLDPRQGSDNDIIKPKVVASATLLVECKLVHSAACRGRIEDVVVDSGYRGMHLGVLLLDTLKMLAMALRCYKISVDCKKELAPYYIKLGYVDEGMCYLLQRFSN